jgi:hypothetical protein
VRRFRSTTLVKVQNRQNLLRKIFSVIIGWLPEES